jgi:predicted O-methyltransferase YrrM
MTTYLDSLEGSLPVLLEQIEAQARKSDVPIIRKQTQSFLKMLLALHKPVQILEIGTAVAFSTLFFAEYTGGQAKIITIENYAPRIAAAKENIKKSEYADRITLLEGDALQILPEMTDSFDFIFMDAAKGQYIHFLPHVLRMLKPGGVLVSDNVLQEGDIIQSHFAVTRRNRTIYKRMREYLYELTHSEELTTSVLPVGDGVAVSVRKG